MSKSLQASRSRKLPKTRMVGAIDLAGHGLVLKQPVPALLPGRVLIRVYASMISPGTHLGGAKKAREQKPVPTGNPYALGYQAAGDVWALGEGVTQFKIGDRVACFGTEVALHSDWDVVPQNLCVKLPENVDYEQASAMNLVLTALQAVRRAGPDLGGYLLVVGQGLVGQLAAQIAQLSGMYVMGSDGISKRLQIAKRCGVQAVVQVGKEDLIAAAKTFTNGHGFDAAIMAIGGDGSAALKQVSQVMKISPDGHAMGQIVMVGGLTTTSQWGAALGNLDVRCSARSGPGYHDPLWELDQREYPPVFIRWTTRSNMELSLRWIAEGRLKIKPLITHRLPLAKMEQAVDLLVDHPDKAMGVVITTI